MNRIAALTLLSLAATSPATPAQSHPAADPETLQAILLELRAIHNEVRLSETTQILLTELQVQRSALNQATQRRDDLRTRLSQLQSQLRNLTQQLARAEDSPTSNLDTNQRRQLSDNQENLKNLLASLRPQEQEAATNLQHAEDQLHREQDTLDSIQAQLDTVVKRLQPAATQ